MTGAPPSRTSRPLRVGICASYDLGRSGGVNTHIRAQARALRSLGHEVCVFGASSAPLEDGEVSLGGCISLVIGDTETGFGVDPRSCIIFEDSPSGIRAARAAGARVVGVNRAGTPLDGTDLTIRDFTDPALPAWLDRL